jgi:flagellar hook-associated protein 1 FlgK
MAGYDIGISGLHAAQKALMIIGNNIANAATEGYHRQEIDLVPLADANTNGAMIGQGVEYAGVIRKVDAVLQAEILRQESSLAAMERQLEMLQTIESAFGELTTGGLTTAMDEFFASFQDLSLRTEDVNMQSEVLSKAQALVSQMNNIATMVTNMDEMAHSESLATVERINLLAEQISALNQEIYNQKMRGYEPNNTMDQREKLITELGRLIGIRTYTRDNGMVDIIASDISLVIGPLNAKVEIGLINDGQSSLLGLRSVGGDSYSTQLNGGKLGGLFELRNTTIRDLQDQLDLLAKTIITETNKIHVQGVGQDGSFASLTGWTMSQTVISQIEPPITPGTFYVRVTDIDGNTVSHSLTLTANSTLAEIADALAAIPGLSGTSFSGGRLQIIADTGSTFDFLPGVRTRPTSTLPDPLVGAGPAADEAPPLIQLSGLYTGSANQTYTCTVNTLPPGETLAVGNGSMELVVVDGSGVTVATVNIGEGYTPGQSIALADGIYATLSINGISAGYFNDGDQFDIEAIADSDPTDFLAATGMNCFFSGTTAISMDTTDYVKDSGRNIATSRSPEKTGNSNVVLLAKLGDQTQASLGSNTMKDYYRQIAVGLGNQISVVQMKYDNTDGVLRSLSEQREVISGVDINDQASLMMLFERMFQAMARYMNTITETQKTVLTLVS